VAKAHILQEAAGIHRNYSGRIMAALVPGRRGRSISALRSQRTTNCEKPFRKRLIPSIDSLGSDPQWSTDRQPLYAAIQWLRNKFQNARE
jgi:hypothetical protein